MSQPPEYPGSRRLKRAAASAGGSAYQGAFEAVGSILIACAVGYWVDRYFDTGPVGLLVGTVLGFAAFVLRLVRLGKELNPDGTATDAAEDSGDPTGGQTAEGDEDGFGVGVRPGLSDALRDDREEDATPADGSEGDGSERSDWPPRQ